MAERHYKREKVRGISLEKVGLWSGKSFGTPVNIRKAFQRWRDRVLDQVWKQPFSKCLHTQTLPHNLTHCHHQLDQVVMLLSLMNMRKKLELMSCRLKEHPQFPLVTEMYLHTHNGLSHFYSMREVKFSSQRSKDKKSDNVCILIETCRQFQMQNRAFRLTVSLPPALQDRAVTVSSSKGVKGDRTDICHNNDFDCLTQQARADLQHTCLKRIYFSFLLCSFDFWFHWMIVELCSKQRTKEH